MKLKVTSTFRDKDDHVTVYNPDTILEVRDKDRGRSLIDRGLCKEFKGKTAPAHILGTEEGGVHPYGSEDGTDENPDTGASAQEQSSNSNQGGDE
ncbi:hypothetical protein [Prevotella sp. OH937_COT-195]|uniref:hypothetical protein n=1 Tax=Prevotella sp. OH937_COT-195 TaxID=2491051 RepID=UPI000F64E4F8|nr:hypothetical protein [Prevotella sp. OH937_COT-195]RRC97468.1 hypothetical protein EII32_10400 [Prevotella sp. OH937_COT-195]